jgi:hypothetical protein
MKSTGQNSERVGYKVVLLLVVGLTAFSSAMKELNQLQQFAVEGSRLIEQLAENFVPPQIPQVPVVPEVPQAPQPPAVPHPAIEVETCELHQSPVAVDLPWLSNVARTTDTKPRAVGPRPSQVIDFKSDLPGEVEIAKLKKIPQIDVDRLRFEFRMATNGEPDAFVFSELPAQFKTKTRRHRDFRMSTRDREILLKTLNRSINLRFAS